MWFLINNPWVLFILLAVIGLLIYIGSLIRKEILFNSLLKEKQYSMRINVQKRSPLTKKMAILTASAITPVIVIALVLSVSLGMNNEDLGTIGNFNSASDITDLYSDYSNKMESYDVTGFNKVEYDLETSVDEAMDDIVPNLDYKNIEVGLAYQSKEIIHFLVNDDIGNAISDGTYIYTISDSNVLISIAYTSELNEGALDHYKSIEISNTYIIGMYVDSDYLIVLSRNEYSNKEVTVNVYNKNNMFSLEDTYKLSGEYLGSKKVGENLFVITSTDIPFNEDIDLDNYLPEYNHGATVKASYQDIVYSEGTYPNSFTTFYGIDLDAEDIDMEVVLGDSDYDLYISETSMYLFGNAYVFETLTNVVTLENPIAETKTAIMKIEINGNDLEYVFNGFVEGYALNQLSVNEYDGFLHMVTSSVEPIYQNTSMISSWKGETINRLWIFDNEMKVLSVIGDGSGNDKLGVDGETVQSSTCIEDYCYITTFEQTNLYYVIDVSDVENPIIIGEQTVPGTYNYLQPINKNFMLGISFKDSLGRENGMTFSIYDTRDLNNIILYDEYILDDGIKGFDWSSATYNYNDIFVNTIKGFIEVPYTFTSYVDRESISDSGILMLEVGDDNKIENSFYVSHETNYNDSIYIYQSIYIHDYLYTISKKYIMASLISNPEAIMISLDLED